MRSMGLWEQQQHLRCQIWSCSLPPSEYVHTRPQFARIGGRFRIRERHAPAAVASPLKQAHSTSSPSAAVATTAADSHHGPQQLGRTVSIRESLPNCIEVHDQPLANVPQQRKPHTLSGTAELTACSLHQALPRPQDQETISDINLHSSFLQQHSQNSTCMQQPATTKGPDPGLDVSLDGSVVAKSTVQPRVPHHERVWRPKWNMSKIVSIAGVCRMLQQHARDLSPVQWVCAYSRVVDLVSQGQSVSAQGWRQLRQGIEFLAKCDAYMIDAQPVSSQGAAHILQTTKISKDKGGESATAADTPEAGRVGPAVVSTVQGIGTSATYFLDRQQQQQQLRSWQQRPMRTETDTAAQQLLTAPISRFSSRQLCAMLWATAKLGLQLQPPTWPSLLAHTCHVSANMRAYETATVVWALAELHPPRNVEHEVQEMLRCCKQALQAFPPRSLVILTLGLVKLNVTLSQNQKHQLIQAVALHLLPSSSRSRYGRQASTSTGGRRGNHQQEFSGRDLCQLVWSFARLGITPPAAILTAALRASKRHLSVLDWDFITALLRGVGWLRFVPPGPWLLELYDQLYWTVDQLSLGQLCCVIWSLGRLRLVAVPPELLERLLTFATLRCQQVQHDMHQQLQQQSEQAPDLSSRQTLRGAQRHVDSKALARQHHTFAKYVSLLLSGLAGLKPQLDNQQLQQCRSWVLAVLEVTTPEASKQVAGSLLAAAKLGVQLTTPTDQLQVHGAVSVVSSNVGVEHVAQAVLGAVAVAGPPSPLQFQQWLQHVFPGLPQAGVAEVHMLLQACVCARQQPSQDWLLRALQRMMQLAPALEGRNCAHQSQLLLQLVAQAPRSQRQQHQQHEQELQQWRDKVDLQQLHRHSQQYCNPHQNNDEYASSSLSLQKTSQQQASCRQQAAFAYLAEEMANVASAGSTIPAHAVRDLMAILSKRVEQLELKQDISSASLQRFEHSKTRLLKLMSTR